MRQIGRTYFTTPRSAWEVSAGHGPAPLFIQTLVGHLRNTLAYANGVFAGQRPALRRPPRPPGRADRGASPLHSKYVSELLKRCTKATLHCPPAFSARWTGGGLIGSNIPAHLALHARFGGSNLTEMIWLLSLPNSYHIRGIGSALRRGYSAAELAAPAAASPASQSEQPASRRDWGQARPCLRCS